jgi:excisionase family DNA binding protein
MTIEYWTIEQAAERASVSEHTIRAWIKKGSLPSAQAAPRGRHLIRPTDLAELLTPRRHR